MFSRLGSYLLGDAIKITSTLSGAVNSATITVTDSSGTVQVNAQAMSADSSTVYSYTFQTDSTWGAGECQILITVATATYTNIEKDNVFLVSAS